MNLELNEQEARALMQLLDIACKAGGLSVASAAIVLAQKIEAALKPAAPKLQAVSDS